MPAEIADPELAKSLKQARQKPRNFAILAKGASVVKLLVSKKPLKTGEINEAKSSSKATSIYKGVCQGDGGGVIFRVTDSEPTIKLASLKDFINEQTGLTIKPKFEVVKELEEVNDDEDGESPSSTTATGRDASTAKEEISSTATSEPKATGTVEDPKASIAALTRKLNQLTPKITEAVKAFPDRKAELLAPVAAFQRQAKAGDVEGATASLLAAAKLVGKLPTGGPATKEQASTVGSPLAERVQAAGKLAQQWTAAREQAGAGITGLLGALGKIRHPVAGEVAEVVESLQENFPTFLDEALAQLASARDNDKFAEGCRLAKAGAANALRYLDGNADDIALCERNPFGTRVLIARPLRASLQQVMKEVQRLEKL